MKINKYRCLKNAVALAVALEVVMASAMVVVAQMPTPAPIAHASPSASQAPFGSAMDTGKELRHITIRGKFDADNIKVQNGAVWIEHLSFDKPTELSINGVRWNPTWQGNTSDRFQLPAPVIPFGDAKVRVRKLLGRSPIALLDLPSAKNNQTLTIKAVDSPVGVDT